MKERTITFDQGVISIPLMDCKPIPTFSKFIRKRICSPGWFETYYVDQAALELIVIHLPLLPSPLLICARGMCVSRHVCGGGDSLLFHVGGS